MVNMSASSVAKKRGRKPKGVVLETSTNADHSSFEYTHNVILQLKCHLSDITEEEEVQPVGNGVWKKIRELKIILHKGQNCYKKSACLWCTFDFYNPPIYIPSGYSYDTKQYTVYGCFCSPECAAAHLSKEHIDVSMKFERYQLLNQLYGDVFQYTSNIIPAGDPRYMLDKFLGNLTIQEYRSLFKKETVYTFVDKPMVCVMPELIEDNYGHKSIQNNSNNIYIK